MLFRSPDGRPWLEFYRQASGYLLRFPGLADFDVPGGSGPVSCHPAPEVTEDTTTHLFLNQVSPLLASSRGALVFHASVVDCRGSAIAFVGESGRGKSTLAARFATSGYGFLSDDGLAVAGTDGGFFALPGHPSLRLWDDSQAALMREGGTTVLPVQYTEKSRFVATDELLFCNQPRRLRRAYFLAEIGRAHV